MEDMRITIRREKAIREILLVLNIIVVDNELKTLLIKKVAKKHNVNTCDLITISEDFKYTCKPISKVNRAEDEKDIIWALCFLAKNTKAMKAEAKIVLDKLYAKRKKK